MEEPYLTFRAASKAQQAQQARAKRAKAEGSGTGAAPLPAGIMPTGAGLKRPRFRPVVGRGKAWAVATVG